MMDGNATAHCRGYAETQWLRKSRLSSRKCNMYGFDLMLVICCKIIKNAYKGKPWNKPQFINILYGYAAVGGRGQASATSGCAKG